ncbi:hypothetical protein J4220_02615 [Candidatus Micrarchaeota archaeon]|nr:hypothetical protein [Candidatus Micrarchaeota archaeon]
MSKYPEIKWVEVARRAIVERLEILEKMDKMLSKSTLTQEDALRIGREINKKVWLKDKRALGIEDSG